MNKNEDIFTTLISSKEESFKNLNLLDDTAASNFVKNPFLISNIDEGILLKKRNQFDFYNPLFSDEEDNLETLSFCSDLRIKPVENIEVYPKLSQKKEISNEFISADIPKKKQKQSRLSCKCKHSNCFRLHCACFKTLGYCSEFCRCRNCLNKKQYEKAREFVI